jgi:hypothetical protein
MKAMGGACNDHVCDGKARRGQAPRNGLTLLRLIAVVNVKVGGKGAAVSVL